jgi:hypothetical protein
MGASISWVAIHGRDQQSVLDELGWRRTGAYEEFPESATTCTMLKPGWFLIAMLQRADAYDGSIDLRRLSTGADLVACFVEEHVMFSGAASWRDGSRIWSVEHDGQKEGFRDLVVTGDLPGEMFGIIDKAKASQDAEGSTAEVDFFFDIPVDIARQITGFRYDRADVDGVPLKFEVLHPVERARRSGLLKSIFGGQ